MFEYNQQFKTENSLLIFCWTFFFSFKNDVFFYVYLEGIGWIIYLSSFKILPKKIIFSSNKNEIKSIISNKIRGYFQNAFFLKVYCLQYLYSHQAPWYLCLQNNVSSVVKTKFIYSYRIIKVYRNIFKNNWKRIVSLAKVWTASFTEDRSGTCRA